MSRRQVVALGAGALATGGWATGEPSLDALARAKGLRFGTAVGRGSENDPAYRQLVARECGIIVPENELKLYALKPAPGDIAFAEADKLAALARTNGQLFRGHTLLWNRTEFIPKWLQDQGLGPRPEQSFTDYVRAVAGRYRDVVQSWDVVNETINPATGAMHDTLFTRALGPDVVELAFRAAREAAPKARLAYNDYMGWGDGDAKHRAGVLKLLERLKARNVPIDALGIQGHIGHSDGGDVVTFSAADQRDWRRFLDEARGMGLDLLITEFDVNDTVLPADPAKRDAQMAALARDYLDLMLDYRETKQVLAWGLGDRYSWLRGRWPRPDGLVKRPTLYDDALSPKPLREAVAAAFRAAPERAAWA
jgi:endo-1,4-beta-xylanase